MISDRRQIHGVMQIIISEEAKGNGVALSAVFRFKIEISGEHNFTFAPSTMV